MELDLATSLMNFVAAALTFGAVAIPLFKKPSGRICAFPTGDDWSQSWLTAAL